MAFVVNLHLRRDPELHAGLLECGVEDLVVEILGGIGFEEDAGALLFDHLVVFERALGDRKLELGFSTNRLLLGDPEASSLGEIW